MANLNPTTVGTVGFPNAVAIYYDKRLLTRLEFDLHMQQFGEKKALPKSSGNEIKWTRYTNFAESLAELADGVVPDGEVLASSQISAIPKQYGNYVTLTDMLITEAIDPVIQGATDVLSYQAAKSLDSLIQTTLHNAMTNQFAGAVANEGLITAVVNAAEIRKAVKTLKTAAVRPLPGGYAGCIHPATAFDLQSDNAIGAWLDILKYTTPGPLYTGEIGKMYGVRFVESQNIKTGSGLSSPTYRNWIIGKEAYGVVELAGHNMKMIAKQLGSSGVADPLDQLSTVGYKFSHITKVLDAVRAIELMGCSAS